MGEGQLEITEVHRFPNRPVRVNGTLHWDILGLYRDILDGLHRIDARSLDSVGIDSWAVDYGLLDKEGRLLSNPIHYRDDRTAAVIDRVHDRVAPQRLYEINGLQFLPFNTLYQLAAEPFLDQADTLLLVPDLISVLADRTTRRGTDQRLDDWSLRCSPRHLVEPAHRRDSSLPPGSFPASARPAHPRARDSLRDRVFPGTPVTAVASHDTASAVAAVPAAADRSPTSPAAPGRSPASSHRLRSSPTRAAAANFTNEAGVDGTIRYLRNIMGLWLLPESLRTWNIASADLPALLVAPRRVPAAQRRRPRRPGLHAPRRHSLAHRPLLRGHRPARAQNQTRSRPLHHGEPRPRPPDHHPAGSRAVRPQSRRCSRRRRRRANPLLCQLTADATGLPVIAGPVEATALGNIGVQARSLGLIPSLASLRSLIAETQPLHRYEPTGSPAVWTDAAARLKAPALASAPA